MLTDDVKKRIYADALSAEAELIERDLTVETVREWLEELEDGAIVNLISAFRGQAKETIGLNRTHYYQLIGDAICWHIERRVMDAAVEQLEGKIDEIYAEAERK